MADNPIKNFIGESPFIKFSVTNPFKGIYKGVKSIEDTFNPGKTRLSYTFDVEGNVKQLDSSSKRLAEEFLKKDVQIGDSVTITRTGEGVKTFYTIEVSDIPF